MLLPLLLNLSVQVSPTAIATGESFGTASVSLNISPTVIATGESVPSPSSVSNILTPRVLGINWATWYPSVSLSLSPTAIPTAEAIYAPTRVGVVLFPTLIASEESFGAPGVIALASATALLTGYSTSHRPQMAEYRHLGYVNNGWDKLVRWDGRQATTQLAGIAPPSGDKDSWQPVPTETTGDTQAGLHVFRYRFLDSVTGYVSNPSEEREVIVSAGNAKLTFDISTTGAANIIRSTDAKVDKIVIEMSTVQGGFFRKAAEGLNSASTIDVDLTDAFLEEQFLAWPEDGHDVPPVAKNIVSHRDRIWLFGQVVHTTGTLDVTNGSPDADAGSVDPDWRSSVFGDSTLATQVDFKSAAWFLVVSGDSRTYEIDTYDEANDKLILTENYAGSTAPGVRYQIFSRANVIWVSEPNYPESFKPLSFLSGPSGEGSGDITAGLGVGGSMVFFAPSSMFKLTWSQGPLTDPVQIPISTKHGALNQNVVIEVDGSVYAMDRRGWTTWRGVFPRNISKPIDGLRELIDYEQSDSFHAVYMPELRAIRWYVAYQGDTSPKNYIQLDLESQTWATGVHHQTIKASRLVPSTRGIEVLFGDDQGHLWIGDLGTVEGCEISYSHLTALVGATTTVVPISGATLPIGGAGLTGCFAYHLSSGEARLITANSSIEVTVSPAFSTAPATGDTVWVGAIPSKLKTKAFSAKKLGDKTKTRYLWLQYRPTDSARKLQLRVYEDLSSTAKTWATPRSDPNPGVEWPATDSEYPTSDWILDMSQSDGNMQVPIGSEYKRHFSLEFEINEPDAPIELLVIEYDSMSLEDEE